MGVYDLGIPRCNAARSASSAIPPPRGSSAPHPHPQGALEASGSPAPSARSPRGNAAGSADGSGRSRQAPPGIPSRCSNSVVRADLRRGDLGDHVHEPLDLGLAPLLLAVGPTPLVLEHAGRRTQESLLPGVVLHRIESLASTEVGDLDVGFHVGQDDPRVVGGGPGSTLRVSVRRESSRLSSIVTPGGG